MPLILVIEQEEHTSERIQGALGAEGWAVRVVGDREAAKAVAGQSFPDLVVVSTATAGGAASLQDFASAHGGPGAFALLQAGEQPPAGIDGSLAKPFTDEQLRVAVRRCLSRVQKALAEQAAVQAASAGEQLTSQDLFGDLLAEVEEEAAAQVKRPAETSRATADEVDRKLEQTLSGVLATQRMPAIKPAAAASAPAAGPPSIPAPAAAPPVPVAPPPVAAAQQPAPAVTPAIPPASAPPPRPVVRPSGTAKSRAEDAAEIDDLLSQTLSGLGVGPRPKPRPQAPAAMPVAPPTVAPAAAAPTAAPPVAAPEAALEPPAAMPAPEPAAATLEPLVPAPAGEAPVAAAEIPSALSGEPLAAPAAAAAPAPQAQAPVEEPPAEAPPREEPPPPQPPAGEPPTPEPARREPPSRRERRREEKAAQQAQRMAAAKPTAAPTPWQPAAAASSPSTGDALATQRLEVVRPAGTPEPAQFGQYTLLDRVALGGMAEVWKARMKGVEGFQKTVAIKKILAHLTDSVDFVTMFIDEAKLAAQLNHPNIIHIYDLGKIDDDYYIAMEYVEGKDLRSILNTARKREAALPVGLALLVAARLASGLDYAHRKRDFDNRELGLVHRDVSPQNVLISYEGDIKLCDFGIVKAVAKASKTQMGALKGKLQYMSPEQAWGRVVDARSDIFSLGSVLFEMLAGRRLFAGDSEISVLEAVRECRTQALREVEPAIPDAVDAIVRRALAKDPDERYQTAGEMQKELESVLYSMKPTPSQAELATYMHRLFGDEATPQGALAAAAPVAAAAVDEREAPAVAPIGALAEPEEGRRRPWLLPAAAAAVVLVGILWFVLGRDPAVDTAALDAPATPTTAAVPAAPPGPAPGATVAAVPAAAPPVQPDLTRIEEELRAKEQRLREEFEAQRRALTEQIEEAGAAAPAAPEATRSPVAVETPAPAAPPPPPPPVQERPAVVEAPPPPPPTPAPAATEAPRPAPAPAAPPVAEAPARPTVKEGDTVSAGTPGLVAPAFVSITKPEYPAVAKRMRVEGSVVISVLVDEHGQVAEARLVRGVPQNVGINEAALKAARSARYRPATMGGVRVRTWANMTIPFKL